LPKVRLKHVIVKQAQNAAAGVDVRQETTPTTKTASRQPAAAARNDDECGNNRRDRTVVRNSQNAAPDAQPRTKGTTPTTGFQATRNIGFRKMF